MKFKNVISVLFIVFLLFSSCGKSDGKKSNVSSTDRKEIVENIKNIEVDIEGMTCEIGCARLIQSKLYKTKGVKFADVNFEKKSGNITFDANELSTEDIKNEIQKIAGGDLYKVTHSKEVESFSVTN
jgi:Cu+-exporting ATPase